VTFDFGSLHREGHTEPTADVIADDHRLAEYLATETGRHLIALRTQLEARDVDPWDVKDAGDAVAHRFLIDSLRRWRPHDAVLSEEGADDPVRLTAQRVWIIDPLDGTTEFSEPGRSDWAVHVALWTRDAESRGELTAGAVALPALATTYCTHPAPATPPAPARTPIMVVSRTRTPAVTASVARELGFDGARLGSAGAKTMAVVSGVADVYLHDGGQHQWDSAAPVAVARAAGLHTSRIDGSPLIYNERDTWLPDLLVCRPELAGPILAAVQNFTSLR
jgi:3'(2'), 5'-bisphosphate nucleotidase